MDIVLENKFKERGLSNSSIQTYLKNLKKLNDDEPLKNLNFLNKYDVIKKKLEKYKPNTQRNFLIAICSALNSFEKPPKVYSKYFDDLKNINAELKTFEKSGEKSQTQKDNWIEWSEVLDKYNELKEKVGIYKNKNKITKNEYNNLLQFIILSLYVLIPPRRNKDYLLMVVLKGKKIPEDTDKNYLDLDNKKFIFNNFKTAKTEGSVILDIPDELLNNIKLYLKFRPDAKGKTFELPFLVFADGEKLTNDNSITLILNKIFGKKISSSLLRHIFLQHTFGNVKKEQEKIAKEMSHSVGMQQDYIKD